MSARDWLHLSLDHAQRSLDQQRDPPNLHRYPSVPAADEPDPDVARFKRQVERDNELRERLRQEQQDEPRHEAWEDRYAR